MCGIFGVQLFDSSKIPDHFRLRDSVASVNHRGPDAALTHVEPGLGLGHARLSLVDAHARSNQPMWDDAHRHGLIYNGEVYNFAELRSELERSGVTFKTTSDTEVVLHALINWGERALLRFDGMFALAFFDRSDNSILLARDRFGMKPLFWTESITSDGPAFLFGSEVKTFRPWLDLQPDISSVLSYLMKFGGPTSGRTFYAGVVALKPGTRLIHRPGQAPDIAPYFELTEFLDEAETDRLSSMTPKAVADEFEILIDDAVRTHLFSDARIGAFCSGGVDSSLLVAMAARHNKDVALFHANVKGSWSELEPATKVANHFGFELNSIDVEEQDFIDMIPRVTQHYEYPFSYHRNCPPLLMIAEMARDRGVKGLLSGEGSDELFLGYPWLGRKRLTDSYDSMVAKSAGWLRKIPGFGPILVRDQMGNFAHVREIASSREIADDVALVTKAISNTASHRNDPTHSWSLDYMHYHLRTLLHRNDTMGMAASIEARFPFLDNKLARFGVNLPGRFKLRKSIFALDKAHPFVRDKWVVREVANRHMPRDLGQRIKVGFWTTVFDRLEISPQYFANSPLTDMLSLSRSQLRDTVEQAPPDLRLRLLLTDVWITTVLDHQQPDKAVSRLRDHVMIRSEGVPPRQSEPATRTPVAPI